MKLAVFLPNWVGDVVMATPTLRALRRHFGPQAEIVGIMRPHLAELFEGSDWLNERWFFDPKAANAQWRRLALIARMRYRRFDMAVLLTNSLHTALLAWLGGAKQRIGYDRDHRGRFLTQKLYPPDFDGRWLPRPMVEYYLDVARAAGCSAESPRLELPLTAADEELGGRIWHDLGLRGDGRVIALNSTGAYGASKLWPVEHCAALAQRLVRQLDCDVLVLSGPKEREMASDIVAYAASSRVLSLASHTTSLAATKAALARCQLLISTDSGPRHIAAALGRPVITLMGPTLPVWIENPTVRGSMLRLELDCSGCGKRTCPRGHHHCMRHLAPQDVFEAAAHWLDEQATKAA